MNFYQVRLKRHPHLYLPKKGMTYSLMSDQDIESRLRYNKTVDDVFFIKDDVRTHGKVTSMYFVFEKYARTYTDPKQIISLRNNKWPKKEAKTFKEYEVVEYPSGNVYSLDDFKA